MQGGNVFMTKIYLVRHGETTWNADARAQGSKDVALSERGRLQAQLLAKRMKNYHIDHIFSSDLIRAYETASIIAEGFQSEVNQIHGFREMSFGEWEGLTNDEIKQNYDTHFKIWRSQPHKAQIPGGEMLLDVQKRGLQALHQLVNRYKGQSILIVSHGTALKAILLGLLDIDLSYFYKIRQDNTCINLVEFRDYGPVVVTLNDTAHTENILY